jgi:hypothetical protein
MRRFTTLLLFTLLLSMFTSTLTAQNRSRRMNIEDYEKRKMEFIKTQAGLTNSEAEKYFPLNSELTKKKFDLRILHRDKVQIQNTENFLRMIWKLNYRKLHLIRSMLKSLRKFCLPRNYTEHNRPKESLCRGR